jgi:xanthine dehydrogenase accessory factor
VRALAEGTPRLIALSPHPESDHRPGVSAFPMTCHSGGCVDIYIEPVLPAPRLVVFGLSPVAQALVRLAKAMGYAADAVDPDADRAAFPDADRVLTTLDLGQLRQPPAARGATFFAVVATMGQRDDEAVRLALELGSRYIGLIASRRRFEALRGALLAHGVTLDDLGRVHCPAGLDLGAHTPEEIALSVVAEIVRLHRTAPVAMAPAEAAAAAPAAALSAPAVASTTRDPVCGMTVTIATAKHRADLDGHTYYFCCGGCRERFLAAPERFTAAAAESEGAT